MVFLINEQSRIQDPRNYGPDIINELRGLLMAGECAQRDPRRQDFYELRSSQHTFYIHISPVNGNVLLLARWLSRPAGNSLKTTAPVNNPDELLTAICR